MKTLHSTLVTIACTLACIFAGATDLSTINAESLAPKAIPIYGPYWVKFNAATCDGAKLYLQGILLFGTEVGCTNNAGAAYVGYFDSISSAVYLNTTGGSSQAQGIWQLLLAIGKSWAILGNGSSAILAGPYPLSVDVSKPAWAIN